MRFLKLLGILTAVLAVLAPAAFAELRVALLLDRGGKDDKSFNASAYEGATEARKKLGITLKYVEASDDNAFEPLLRAFAQKDFDLIIGIGFAQKESIAKVAAHFSKSTKARTSWAPSPPSPARQGRWGSSAGWMFH